MKTEKKQYRLKRWYPSLPLEWKDNGIIIVEKYDNISYKKLLEEGVFQIISSRDVENNPDFWEEVKQPLFTTEDGVEVFSDIDNLFAINLTYFSKTQNTLRSSGWLIDNPSYKVFSIESSADEYIWRNKPVFSYHEIWKYAPYGSPLSIFEQLAKERIEQ